MKLQHFVIIFFSSLFLFGCQQSVEEQAQKALISNTQDQRRLKAVIDSLEKIVYTENFDLNEISSANLMDAYSEYTTKFVVDKERAPEYLYKSAAISRAIGLPIKAIKLYDKILAEYPDYEKNPEVAFLLAFTYDEDMKQPERAKEAYEELIEKFPDDMWAEQASARLENIDKSDEELIQSFLEKNKAN